MNRFRFFAIFFFICVLAALCGCQTQKEQEKGNIAFLIGISQANMRETWRLELTQELKDEAAKHPDMRLIFTDAAGSYKKQIKDVERLISFGIDLLIISPSETEQLAPMISQVYQRIPVIIMDRAVEGYDYTLFIGPDNRKIGQDAGAEIVSFAAGNSFRVLEIRGAEDSQANRDRSAGFADALHQNPEIALESITIEDNSRDSAEDQVLLLGENIESFNAIFTHNDAIALGAARAIERLGIPSPKIISIDGFAGENGGLQMIRNQQITETITAPTGGREAIQSALDILHHVNGVPKRIILRSHRITAENLSEFETNLQKPPHSPKKTIIVGHAQVGRESAWRLANFESIKKAAAESGIQLMSIDGNQSQEKQIAAVREFIRRNADVIVLSPVIGSGWKTVLEEANDAGIPVLLSDRAIDPADSDRAMTFIGADFIEEGRRAMRWVLANVPVNPLDNHPIRILEMQGTPGASPTIERKKGFELILKDHPEYEIIHSASGDFTKEGGRKVIETYLEHHPWDTDVIYAHNDDMALGAIEVLEEHNIMPGIDVKIISVDGTKEALNALAAGKLNCVIECSPLLGQQLMKAVIDLMSGRELPIRIITDEVVFTAENVERLMKNRKY